MQIQDFAKADVKMPNGRQFLGYLTKRLILKTGAYPDTKGEYIPNFNILPSAGDRRHTSLKPIGGGGGLTETKLKQVDSFLHSDASQGLSLKIAVHKLSKFHSCSLLTNHE